MVCPKCGFQCSDEATFCGSCGAQFNKQEQSQAVVQPGSQPKPVPGKMAGRLIPVTFILTVILLIVSILLPMMNDFSEIPVVKLGLEGADVYDEITDIKEEVQDIGDQMESAYDRYEDDMSAKEKRLAKNILKETERLGDKFSLLNFRRLAATVNKSADELEDYLGHGIDVDGLDEAEAILTVILIVVFAMFLLPLIFTLLGGLRKSKPQTITALVFMVLSQLILCGVLWAVLSMVIYITQAVLCGKARQAKLAASAS